MIGYLQSISVMKRLAIIFIAVCSIIIFISADVAITLQKNSQDGTVINVAGRQRMLTKKFASEILLEVQHLSDKTSASSPNAFNYNNTIRLYEVSLQALKNGGNTFSDLGMNTPITLINNNASEFKQQLTTVEKLWLAQKKLGLDIISNIDNGSASTEKIDQFMVANHQTLGEMNNAVLEYNRYAENQISYLIRTILITSALGVFIALILSIIVTRSVVTPLTLLVKANKETSRGNLEQNSEITKLVNNSELGVLAQSIDIMRHTLSSVMRGLTVSASSISRLSTQVANLSDEVNASKAEEEKQYSLMTEASEALSQSTTHVSDIVTSTLESANEAQRNAAQGLENVNANIQVAERASEESEKVATNIAELSDVAAQVYSIIDVIQGIAEQTNLLALNAAIEAARAGDQGRGFAVVADEVRTLASKTNESTAEIADLLNSLTDKVKLAVNSVGQLKHEVETSKGRSIDTAEAIDKMSASVDHTVEQQNVIAELLEQQIQRLHALRESQQFLTTLFQNSSSKLINTTSISVEMSEMAQRISNTLDEFTLTPEPEDRKLS